jgi:hypothetical protein
VPAAVNDVAPEPVLYGMRPAPPPAIFVAEFTEVTQLGAAVPLDCNT